MLHQITPTLDYADSIFLTGYNLDVDAAAAAEDITPYGNQYFPAAAEAALDIDIVSDSVADAAAGTGARTLLLEGLDASYNYQSEIISLNGTTDVHPANAYLRVNSMRVITVGSGGVNAGTITLDVGDANTWCQIPAGMGKSHNVTYTVPAGYNHSCIVAGYMALIAKVAQSARVAVQTRIYGEGWVTELVAGVGDSEHCEIDCASFPLRLPAKTDLRMRALFASANNLEISGYLKIWLA